MMQRQEGSRSNSSHKAPSLLSICRVIALRRGWLSIEAMATCRPCRARRISMIWLSREDSVTVYRSQMHCLGDTAIAIDLGIVNGSYRSTGGVGDEGDPLPSMGRPGYVAARRGGAPEAAAASSAHSGACGG